jgi:hypothetical protein
MDKKTKIIFLSLIALGAYGTIFIYKRVLRKKADETLVTYKEALKIINQK